MRRTRYPLILMISMLLPSSVLLPRVAMAEGAQLVIVPGGGVTRLPEELGAERNRPNFGGIVGLRLSDQWEADARGNFVRSPSLATGGGDIDIAHAEANLVWFPGGSAAVSPYLTLGAGVLRTGGLDHVAANGGAGVRVMVTDRVGLRVDGRDVVYQRAGSDDFLHQPELFAGISFGFGGRPRDTDQDGVIDKTDACPGTPLGARVSASGCPLDGDKDGVFDGLDRCDATPMGALVDGRGCPRDSDGDTILDGLDKCSATAKGVRVDAAGCPLDADKDGVPDGLDKCEATRAGCAVGPDGCPTDTDRDGVCDGLDKCPGTPAMARVDKDGCPIVVSEKETELLDTGMIRLQDVNFETAKAVIQAESYPALEEVGEILSRWPELRIEIGGHTDSRGSDAYNRTLSEARAKAVLDYMTEHFPGLQRDQFTAVGYGESQPIADNTSPLGMAKNRRVEFRVLNTEVLKREEQRTRIVPK